ncbi:oxidoreductase [Leptodontidium sp. 2 PMI_412]|nr:oxidoreductase [Leptodontidium sp. 2 PMI_412]
MASSIPKSIAIIAGAGPGTGSAIARRFAQAYPVVLLARSQLSLDPLVRDITQNGGSAVGIPIDVTSSSSMDSTMDQIKTKFGPDLRVAVAIYNVASKFTRKPFLEQGIEEFLGSLEPTLKGAFNFAHATLPLMLNDEQNTHKYPPTLIFTGATAALKGGSGLSAFAMSKFGIRAMSQALAREFGPKGIHVSHAIIDGIIDTEKTKAYSQDIPDSKIDPNWIAESYWFLHTQPRTSFTHELDLRPYVETW